MPKLILYLIIVISLSSCADNLIKNKDDISDPNTVTTVPQFPHFIALNKDKDAIYYRGITNNLVHVFGKSAVGFNGRGTFEAKINAFGPVKYTNEKGIKCVIAGKKGPETAFGIKRPIKLNEVFQCSTTVFRVKKCFNDCRQAIIEILSNSIERSKEEIFHNEYLIDDCIGVKVISFKSFPDDTGIFNAKFLWGDVGILSSDDYPKCDAAFSKNP